MRHRLLTVIAWLRSRRSPHAAAIQSLLDDKNVGT